MKPAYPTDQVRRTFRRILSGDENGRPPWVRALGEPGDAGWFEPGSAIWEVNGSLATLVGGIRALLMQACHPLALAGVEGHSSYRHDPLGRLQRTNMFLTTTTFGSTRLARQATEAVNSVHQSVFGTSPDGRSYAATDPHLLLWVHLGLVDSMLVAAQHFHQRDVDADAYVAQMAVVGEAVGVRQPPHSEAELHRALVSYQGELETSTSARSVAKFLQFPRRALPLGAWAPYVLLSRVAVDLLPQQAAIELDVPRRSNLAQAANHRLCAGLLRTLRPIVGEYSQAALLSYRRLGLVAPQ